MDGRPVRPGDAGKEKKKLLVCGFVSNDFFDFLVVSTFLIVNDIRILHFIFKLLHSFLGILHSDWSIMAFSGLLLDRCYE